MFRIMYKIPKVQKDAYSFVVAGDYGCDSTAGNTVNAMTKRIPI